MNMPKYDYLTAGLIFALIIIGCFAIYSATYSTTSGENGFFTRQLLWAVVGVLVMIGVSFLSMKFVNRIVYGLYILTLFLLLLVLFIDTVDQGAGRWLIIGPVHVQPAELAKLATILAVSKYLADKYVDVNKIKCFSIAVGLITIYSDSTSTGFRNRTGFSGTDYTASLLGRIELVPHFYNLNAVINDDFII